MQWINIAMLLLLGTVWCQNDIPEDLQDLEKNIANIPGLENFNQSALPSIDDVQDAIKKKCEKNGGGDAFDKLEGHTCPGNKSTWGRLGATVISTYGATSCIFVAQCFSKGAKDDLQQCIQNNFNFTKIQEELAVARKTGSMEEVFAKYCAKSPVVQNCVKNMTNTIEPCLEEEEKSSLKLLLNITESLASFVCYKDGDRIAMFVAEGGFECIDSKKDGLQQCANETLSHRIPNDLSLDNLPLFVINNEGCDDYFKLQSCVVSVLETCEDNTPANIVDALFKFIRRITPCKNHPVPASVLGARNRITRSNPNELTSLNRITRSNPNELNSLVAAYDQLKQKYEPHCLKNGGQKAADEFREALKQVEICQYAVVSNFKRKTEQVRDVFSFDHICEDFYKGLRSCLVNLTQKMEACSSPAEAYVPKFGLELYDSIFKFHCKDDARYLKKFLGEKRETCLGTIHDSTGFCLNKTSHIKDITKEAVVTKKELCGDLKLLRNCFIDMAAQKCPNNANVNEYVTGFTDAIYAPCSGCKMITNFMLISILLFFTKFF